MSEKSRELMQTFGVSQNRFISPWGIMRWVAGDLGGRGGQCALHLLYQAKNGLTNADISRC